MFDSEDSFVDAFLFFFFPIHFVSIFFAKRVKVIKERERERERNGQTEAERDIHRRVSQGGRAGARCESERERGGHAQRREGQSVRERHTQRRSLTRRPPRNKRPHRNKRRRTRRRGWGEEFIRSRKRASLCPIGALE